jgi:hypothetical protein
MQGIIGCQIPAIPVLVLDEEATMELPDYSITRLLPDDD